MKKKGFTLIELLAVIIVLGILLIIAIPSFSNIIKNYRKKLYVSNALLYIEQAKRQQIIDEVDNKPFYYDITLLNDGKKLTSPFGKEIKYGGVLATFDNNKWEYYILLIDEDNNIIGELNNYGVYPAKEEDLLNNNTSKVFKLKDDSMFLSNVEADFINFSIVKGESTKLYNINKETNKVTNIKKAYYSGNIVSYTNYYNSKQNVTVINQDGNNLIIYEELKEVYDDTLPTITRYTAHSLETLMYNKNININDSFKTQFSLNELNIKCTCNVKVFNDVPRALTSSSCDSITTGQRDVLKSTDEWLSYKDNESGNTCYYRYDTETDKLTISGTAHIRLIGKISSDELTKSEEENEQN